MIYTSKYTSTLGDILLAADETGLTGLWFYGAKHFAEGLLDERCEASTPILERTKEWLDIYFGGCEPDFTPPLHPNGTEFQRSVWDMLLEIPYGKTVTYGDIACRLGIGKMSAQAVGGAVGRNRISIIVPCHRVIGADGSLNGYAGGIDKKLALLTLEKADIAFNLSSLSEGSDMPQR